MNIIQEHLELPSKGHHYSVKLNHTFKIRSMTTEDEMKRLNSTGGLPYRNLVDMIDGCILDKVGISCYDFHLTDFQYTLVQLRALTYGKQFKYSSYCTLCGDECKEERDLDSLEFPEIAPQKPFQISNNVEIALNMLTPRLIDLIKKKTKDYVSRHKCSDETAILLVAPIVLIKSINDERQDEVKTEIFLKKLSMRDMNMIQHKCNDLIATSELLLNNSCGRCGTDYSYTFPFSNEFFRPNCD